MVSLMGEILDNLFDGVLEAGRVEALLARYSHLANTEFDRFLREYEPFEQTLIRRVCNTFREIGKPARADVVSRTYEDLRGRYKSKS